MYMDICQKFTYDHIWNSSAKEYLRKFGDVKLEFQFLPEKYDLQKYLELNIKIESVFTEEQILFKILMPDCVFIGC